MPQRISLAPAAVRKALTPPAGRGHPVPPRKSTGVRPDFIMADLNVIDLLAGTGRIAAFHNSRYRQTCFAQASTPIAEPAYCDLEAGGGPP